MPLILGDLQNTSRGGKTRTFDYVTDDALAVVTAAGYFNDAWNELGGANRAPLAVIQVISGASAPLTAVLNTILVRQIANPSTGVAEVLTVPAAS